MSGYKILEYHNHDKNQKIIKKNDLNGKEYQRKINNLLI